MGAAAALIAAEQFITAINPIATVGRIPSPHPSLRASECEIRRIYVQRDVCTLHCSVPGVLLAICLTQSRARCELSAYVQTFSFEGTSPALALRCMLRTASIKRRRS